MRSVVFYISGHGFGHAVRTGEVIRALQRLRPEWRIVVRTRAPRHMLPEGIQYSESEFEPVVIEREAGVVIDAEATLAELRGFLGRQDEVLAREVAFVREQNAELIVADIPAIAGDIAYETGVPCVGISNFTWDWIFEPYAPDCLEPI